MNIQKKFAVATLAVLLGSVPLHAVRAQAMEQPVQMVSGGVGDSGMDAIAIAQKHYSLKLIFAEANGEYLADVGVLIRDQKGNTVVNNTSQGPIVLIKLKPGAYTMVSTVAGDTKTQRIVVHGSGLNTYYVHLHSTES